MPSTPALLSAASCFLMGDSCVTQITPLALSHREQLAWHALGREMSLAPAKSLLFWKKLLDTAETGGKAGVCSMLAFW